MVRPVSFKGFQKGFQGVSLRGFRGFQFFLWELCVCIKYLSLGEPAMGSAAFLNEAVSQLAEAYLTRKEQELKTTVPHEERAQELQKIKMYIADRNVYGIDLNPTAVELAEVSLWLNTIYQGGYVPWFRT